VTWSPGEEPIIKTVDFSQFHMLDHWPFTKRCRTFYGGGRRHLWMAWHFRRREQVLRPFWRVFMCLFGRHHEVLWQGTRADGSTTASVGCLACKFSRPPSEYELERYPRLRFEIESFE
jgi:hypothetical protein